MELRFYASMDCPDCAEPMYAGVNISNLDHQGRPVVPVEMFEQETFECSTCEHKIYTGEMPCEKG